jgi:molybdopterin-binding protein
VRGEDLARFAKELAEAGPDGRTHPARAGAVSARNRLRGIVTTVKRDAVMAQVEMVCGPYRMVSLMSTEAADELGLAPGVLAIASVKSTNVVVELP